MDAELSTKPFAFQQRVEACKALYIAFQGRHHGDIQREMRTLGHERWNRRCLYAGRDSWGKRTPGWPERFGWHEEWAKTSRGEEERRRQGEGESFHTDPGVRETSGSGSMNCGPGSLNCHALQSVDSDAFYGHGACGAGDDSTKLSPADAGSDEMDGAVNHGLKTVAIQSRRAAKPKNLKAASFVEWLKKISPNLNWNWKFQRYIYKQLEKVTSGECKRLMLFVPPRHGKSELVTVRYAAWRLKRNPKMNIIIGSYAQKLANRFSRKIRNVLAEDAARNADTPVRTAERSAEAPRHDPATCSRCLAKSEPPASAGGTTNQLGQAKENGLPACDSESGSQVSRSCSGPLPPAHAGGSDNLIPRRKNTEAEWETREGGGVRAVGVGAGITGFGADLIIVDDPVKSRAEAESETQRENVWNWFNDDLYTRLEPNGAIILIQTRWHEDDLAGRLLREMREEGGEQWTVISLPAIAEPVEEGRSGGVEEERSEGEEVQRGKGDKETAALVNENDERSTNFHGAANASPSLLFSSTPLLTDALHRKPGEALCPERFDEKKLEQLRRKLGTYSFSALYQQRPVPATGGFFKRHWFKIIDFAPPRLKWKRGYDLGFSAGPNSDFTATAKVAFDQNGDMYIDGVRRKRMDYPEQRRLLLQMIRLERDVEHAIEESANGKAIIDDLRRDRTLFGHKFRGVKVTEGKIARAYSWNALAEEGRVHLVRGAWNSEFLQEACSFPVGSHDDQIDAVSIAVKLFERQKKTLHAF